VLYPQAAKEALRAALAAKCPAGARGAVQAAKGASVALVRAGDAAEVRAGGRESSDVIPRADDGAAAGDEEADQAHQGPSGGVIPRADDGAGDEEAVPRRGGEVRAGVRDRKKPTMYDADVDSAACSRLLREFQELRPQVDSAIGILDRALETAGRAGVGGECAEMVAGEVRGFHLSFDSFRL
jgi:hypothetical protein